MAADRGQGCFGGNLCKPHKNRFAIASCFEINLHGNCPCHNLELTYDPAPKGGGVSTLLDLPIDRRRLAKGADWSSAEPINDVATALELLVEGWNDRTTRRLETHRTPRIVIRFYGGHYDRCFSTERYPVTPDVVAAFRERGWLKGTPNLGWTDEDDCERTEAALRAHYAAEAIS